MQSSSPDSHWAKMTYTQKQERASTFFKAVDCDKTDMDELLSCLRDLPAADILSNEFVVSGLLNFAWMVTVDGDFLKVCL